MLCGMTYYQILWYFLIYSFAGWCIEVIYHAVKMGVVVNRGFLCGPVCPVYGFGILAVFAMIKAGIPYVTGISEASLRNETSLSGTLIIFISGIILTTSVELIAGWLLDMAFHARWWDYSNEPLNFHGYICLRFSIIWGLAVVLVVRIVQPIMENNSLLDNPVTLGWIMLAVAYITYFSDFVVTVMIVAGLNRELRELDDMRNRMRTLSDNLSREIGTNTIRAEQKIDESRVQTALAKMELRDALEDQRKDYRQRAAEQKAEYSKWITSQKEEYGKWAEDHKEEYDKWIEGQKEEYGGWTEEHKEEYDKWIENQKEEYRKWFEDQKEDYRRRIGQMRDKLAKSPLFGPGRLVHAFPEMKHRDYGELLRKLLSGSDEDNSSENTDDSDKES